MSRRMVVFKVEVPSLATSAELVDVSKLLKSRPNDLLCLAIDIPIGLLDCSRACDKAARKLLGQPRGTSVFAAPCRTALAATTHASANLINREKTGRGLSQQAFGIIPKIKQVDDAMTPDFPAMGVRNSPRSVLLGGQPVSTNDAQQEDQKWHCREDRCATSGVPRD